MNDFKEKLEMMKGRYANCDKARFGGRTRRKRVVLTVYACMLLNDGMHARNVGEILAAEFPFGEKKTGRLMKKIVGIWRRMDRR